MDPEAFAALFAAALIATTAVRLWLSSRQLRHVARHRDKVPDAFSARIDLASHRRAAAYTIDRTRFAMVEAVLAAALTAALTLGGGIQWIHDCFAGLLPGRPLLAQVAILLAVGFAGAIVELPASWYRHFRLEARHGFNRMTARLFVADLAKGAALAVVVGAPLATLVVWLMNVTGANWWLFAWAAWMGFNILVLIAYPRLIAPLFNEFAPLPAGAVRERVEHLLARCGFRANGLFVMDGSRRSSHGNAYFTGLGKAKRIVFYDTLLNRLEPAEIEAVLAHELGHFRHHHIARRILIGSVASLIALWILSRLAGSLWFYAGLGVHPEPALAPGVALALFLTVVPVFAYPLQPLASILSRRDEFQADSYASRETRAADLARALVKLYKDNAATLTPDPIHSAFYDSHPPASTRIGRLLEASRARDGAGVA